MLTILCVAQPKVESRTKNRMEAAIWRETTLDFTFHFNLISKCCFYFHHFVSFCLHVEKFLETSICFCNLKSCQFHFFFLYSINTIRTLHSLLLPSSCCEDLSWFFFHSQCCCLVSCDTPQGISRLYINENMEMRLNWCWFWQRWRFFRKIWFE